MTKKMHLLESKILKKDIKYSKLESDYAQLLNNYQALLGKVHLIMRAVDNRGFDIGINFEEL